MSMKAQKRNLCILVVYGIVEFLHIICVIFSRAIVSEFVWQRREIIYLLLSPRWYGLFYF